jgi:hypothetical protein
LAIDSAVRVHRQVNHVTITINKNRPSPITIQWSHDAILRSWLWRVSVAQEVDEEISFHIEMRTRELVERGVDPKAAREIVLSRIGDLGQLKRTCEDLGRKRDREMRLSQWLEDLSDDVPLRCDS